MKTFKKLMEAAGPIEKEDLVPGFTFFTLSKDGRSLSMYKITGEKELNVGTVLEVKHSVIVGDKFKQSVISKDFVLGTKGSLKVFKNRKDAMKAFKRSGLQETSDRMKMKLTKLNPGDLFKMLKKHKITIRDLASHMEVTLKRIRQVNDDGLKGNAAFDYIDAIKNLSEK